MIIGIAGTQGAGKGAVVQFFKERGFIHCSARELFLEVLRSRNIEPDRPAISAVANELRERYGVSHVVDEYVARHSPAAADLVIESIYTLGEVEAIRKRGGYVVAVDADPEIRYDRIVHRMSETDKVTKEEFLAFQAKELASEDPAKQNMRAVMEDADFTVTNDGSIEELRVQVEYILEKMGKREEE